jgi:hypothetical protein
MRSAILASCNASLISDAFNHRSITGMLHKTVGLVSVALTAAAMVTPIAEAQTIKQVTPRTCKPGTTTSLVLQGTDLSDALRVFASSSQVNASFEKIEPTQATVQITVPEDAPLGPLGLIFAGVNGPLMPHTILIDDLPAVLDNGNNHSRETAQQLEGAVSVEGVCDASQSDFYRLSVTAGQRLAFEIHTQQLASAMDPLLRITDTEGRQLGLADDDGIGPDVRFMHTFEFAGDYWLEVFDSRHAAAGSAYQLRIGDFPVLTSAYPMVVEAGKSAEVRFAGADAEFSTELSLNAPGAATGALYAAAKLSEGMSSIWLPIEVSRHPQWIEESIREPLAFPFGVSGRLSEAQQVDVFPMLGRKDQLVRFTSRTRSLGSPTLLQMQLYNAAGTKVAESAVSDADEWSFDFKFPDDGQYELRVLDLLRRGGSGFTYWVGASPAGQFSVALKTDAATGEAFAIEPSHGAAAIDLTILRFGYDGDIDIAFIEPVEGLRILNPRVAAAAKEARIYLVADDDWKAEQATSLRFSATATTDPTNACVVDSRALHRLKTPFVINPPLWNDGMLIVGGATPTEAPFTLEPAAPARFARPVKVHAVPLQLKRSNEAFKSTVTLLGDQLPAGWTLSAAADKDTYTTTFNDASGAGETAQLPLTIFADFNGRGRLERYNLPIEWFDPVRVTLDFPELLIRGGRARVRATIVRDGNDPQPMTLTLATPIAGITGPEPIAVAADQSRVEFSLTLGPEASADSQLSLTVTSKFGGQDFTIATAPVTLPIVEGPSVLATYPDKVELTDARSQQQLVVNGFNAENEARDWTRYARFTSANPAIAEVRGSVVYPKTDGVTEVSIEVGGLQKTIPVHVAGMASQPPIAFEAEALVALSKQGCNSGACHGSPSGKGGFRLSLRAFDMNLDELTLIREDFGRRVNTLEPELSLLLQKPLMKVAHGGGRQLHKDDVAYQILKDWIADGAKPDPAGVARVVKLLVYPNEKRILSVNDGGQQLAVTALYSDGKQRDVTELVAYETSNTTVATVDVHGLVTPHSRGEIAILVRFLEHIESIPIMFVEQTEGFEWTPPTPNNYVDELIFAKLEQLQYQPSEVCTDSEFIRRASLDVTGILPSPERTTEFLEDSSPDKRLRLIDELLEQEGYAKFWALKWGDLLRITGKLLGDEGVYKYHRWIEESLRENMPYDEFARQLLTGSGSTLANPPANFYRTATDMNECVENISQVFLGARLQCAKCHNHPFERWTQDNYYGLGAFFNRVQRRKTARPGEMFVYTSFSGDVTQPRTGKVMAPWLPQVGSIDANNDEDRRHAFAEWLIAPDNKFFARIEANRIWSQLFSRGIVDPIDDFRDSNPPSNAPLLDALAKDFVDSGYDRKHLLRTIMRSRTYQASYQTNEFNRDDLLYFSHQEPRLLSAEQLLDAINHSLALAQTFGSLPSGTKATQLPAPDLVKVDFLKTFGQPERSTVCACERADDSNLGMAIELFNGPMMHEKLRDEKNRFRVALAAGESVEDIISEMYLAAVSRQPSDIELKASLDHVGQKEDPVAALEDVCWALFNTDEFLFQH